MKNLNLFGNCFSNSFASDKAFLSLSIALTLVFENFKISFENPPPPKVQSMKLIPVTGEDIFKTSFNITGKWENSSDEV